MEPLIVPPESAAWGSARIDAILGLAEKGLLTPDELARAGDAAPLAPHPAAWRRGAERLLSFAGIALLAIGLIFFFAYNWQDLHRFAKLGLAWGALAACVLAGLFLPAGGAAQRASLLGASLGTGMLLALIGQIYQTGADMWQLFAAWLVLMTPFALLARSSASWLLWILLANLALGRVLALSMGPLALFDLSERDSLLLFAALNLLLALAFEAFPRRLLLTPRRHLPRLLALLWIGPLATGAGMGWFGAEMRPLLPVFVAVAGSAFWFHYRQRRDVPILALLLFAAIGVLGLGLVRVMPDSFLGFNLVALFLIAATGYAAVWLMGLLRQGEGR